MQGQALLIGNSDGMGLATTRRLLSQGWNVIGISRRESPIINTNYQHRVVDVSDSRYLTALDEVLANITLDLCIYFAGIGTYTNYQDMHNEPKVIDVNLTGMVRTAASTIPHMLRNGRGHFMGISSIADELLSVEAPAYSASKAGFSSYLRSLALALRPKGIQVTNVRFGFVDTKMAKGNFRPFMLSLEKAVDLLESCIRNKPVVFTAPKVLIPLVKLQKTITRLSGK